jgi:hypothetical protein
VTITFNPPATPLDCVTEIALGADLTADPSTWVWTDVTAYVRHAAGVIYQTGRADQWSATDETSADLVFDNRDGRFSRHNPSGAYYGQLSKNTPLRSGFDAGEGVTYPVKQYVTEWPNRWDISRVDKTTKIKCAGVRRRLSQGAVARSDMRRTYETADEAPQFYWPMEEENGAAFATAVYGGANLLVTGDVSFGASVVPAGSTGAADLSGGGKLSAGINLPGSVGDTTAGIDFEFSFSLSTIPTDSTKIYHIATLHTPTPVGAPTSGTQYFSLWAVPTASGLCYLEWSDFAEATGLVLHGQAGYLVAGQVYHARLTLDDNGTDISSEFGIDGNVSASATLAGRDLMNASRLTISENAPFTSTTVPAPAGYPAAYLGTGHGLSISHVALWTPNRADPTVTYAATNGHLGETAVDRMTRVCEQEGIFFTAQAGESVTMGPQPTATPLDILDDCAKVDLGVLYQADFGLAYQPSDARTNATSQMSISFGQLGEAPESADDDALYRNQWTVSRPGGTEVTVTNAEGVTYNGLYDDSTQANVENDSMVADQAGWRVNRDSIDVPRWPDVFLNFANAGTVTLMSDFLGLDFGPLVTLTSPPSPHPPESRAVFIEGVQGFFTPLDFQARLTTSPADAYAIGIWSDDSADQGDVGRYMSDGSTLRASLTAGATSFDVDANGIWWTTTADDFDPDLRLRVFPAGTELHGEELDVSAVSDVAGSFVSVGASVGGTGVGPATPGMPASIVAGDTLFLVAVNRNIIPTVTEPSISSALWELVADDSLGNAPANMRVWARTYDGVFTAPGITFSGGGTVDYQAQIAAFRGLPLDVTKVVKSYAATGSSSATDIAAPLMRVRERRRLLIVIGWRADDWTSVATYSAAGTTFTEISEPDVTAGDDQGFVWDYAFQTSAVDVPAGSFVVTGGGAAATRGVILLCDGGHQTMTVSARGAGGTTATAHAQYDRVEVEQPGILALAAG